MPECFRNIKNLKIIFAAMFALLAAAVSVSDVSAAGYSDVSAGTYEIDASLSCYVNAMGGVEFGEPLLEKTELVVDDGGNARLVLHLTKSSVTIYSVTCDTFVDASPSYVTEDRGVTSGTIGIYKQDGTIDTENVSYTLSEDTALNASDEAVHYVETITLPLSYQSDEYKLTLYINSNVMGVQFCEENSEATATTYSATLTVNWDSVGGTAETAKSTEAASSASGGNVVKSDGLSVHYASDEDSAADSQQAEYTVQAYMNIPLLIVLVCVGAALVTSGAVLITSAVISKKRLRKNESAESEADYEQNA